MLHIRQAERNIELGFEEMILNVPADSQRNTLRAIALESLFNRQLCFLQ